jgi:radical SAM superfamily enzyme YgiQ (UPF0313 family)
MKVAIIDALGSASGIRQSARDVVGCGPRRVAGILESQHVEAKILVAEDVIKNPSSMDGFDSLLVSAMSIDEKAVQKIINLWKNKHRHKPAIVGGPIASRPESLLQLGFETVVVGEGEGSLLELLRSGLKVGILPPRFQGTILLDGKRQGIGFGRAEKSFDLESFRKEYVRKYEMLNSFDSSVSCIRDYPVHCALRYYVEITRGCSNFLRTTIPLPGGSKCTACRKCRDGRLEERISCPVRIPPGCGFCSVPNLFGYSRSRNEDRIVREVKELVKAGVRRITLSASDFLDYKRDELVAPSPLTDPCNPPPDYSKIETLLSRLTSIQKNLGISENDSVYMSIENVKPCLFDDEAASIISEYLPNSTIHLGCETGSERHSYELGRPSSPKQALNATVTATRHGLRPYVYFIHGLPGQTDETARKTIESMREMVESGAEKITLYKFKPLPFSAFEAWPSPPLTGRSKASKKIVKTVRKLNMESKRRLLGKTLEVITFKSTREGEREAMITYPLSEGPVVVLFERNIRPGIRVKVKITGVISDRLVKGELI